MGVWGAGLYSGDFAMDLRSTIRAVARLPFDGDRLADILCESQPAAADHPDNEEHTTFWLVVADQFAKRGIECDRVRQKALAIIDDGSDLGMHQKLGMNAAGLKARRKILEEMRQRLMIPPGSSRSRPVLKKPQAFLMEIGDAFVYPTCGGKCINSYFASKELEKHWTQDGPAPWKQDGWAAMVIVDRGLAFDFLSWYQPLTMCMQTVEKPTLAALRGEILWKLAWPGTCSAVHFKRMELEKIGTLPVDAEKLSRAFPDRRPGIRQAIDDISLANELSVGPHVPAVLMPRPGEPPNFSRGRPFRTILGIETILSR